MLKHVLLLIFFTIFMPLVAQAAQPTKAGEVSVAQILNAIDVAPKHEDAKQILIAYVTAISETLREINHHTEKTFGKPLFCGHEAGSININRFKLLLTQGLGTRDPETVAATPIIVDYFIERYNCNNKDVNTSEQ